MTALQKNPYPNSGKYKFKAYFFDDNGSKLARFCKKQNADLQSCAITNPTGSVVLRHLMIDLDAHRAEEQWKKEDGSLDWKMIYSFLCYECPNISKYIEYGTASFSGKGVHILFGFSALPLSDDTRQMQSICAQIQSLAIDIFNEYGLGADTGARGLNRDFSTYFNQNNVLHHNKILTKNINNDDAKRKNKDGSKRTPYLLNLFYGLQEKAKDLEIISTYRLYNNIIVEGKLAKLFLYLMGKINVNPMQKIKPDLSVEVTHKFKKCTEFESVTLTLNQIEHICGLNQRSIKNIDFFNNLSIKSLFNVQQNDDKTITISAKKVSTIEKRITRARKVLSNSARVSRRVDPKLIRPEYVQDGERNLAIWTWVLYYKMAGYSELEALNKVKLRVKYIQNNEGAECKETQLKCIVKSFYRQHRQLIGCKPNCLPDYLADDSLYRGLKICTNLRPIDVRRKPCPSSLPSLENRESKNTDTLPSVKNFRPELILINSVVVEKQGIKKIDSVEKNATNISKNKIRVVRYKQKIGFFHADNLILCVTNSRNYKLKNIIPKISTLVAFAVDEKSFIHPRKNDKNIKTWNAKIDKEKYPIKSHLLCGKKKTFAHKILDFKKKNENNFKNSEETIEKDFDVPF